MSNMTLTFAAIAFGLVLVVGCSQATDTNVEPGSIVFLIDNGRYERALEAISEADDVNVANRFGVTPLMAASGPAFPVGEPDAVKRGYELQELEFAYLVESLILNGADVTAKDQNGVTALHRAARNNRLGTAFILVSNGATFSTTEERLPHEVLIAARECYPTMTILLARAAANQDFDPDRIFGAIDSDVNICDLVKSVNLAADWRTSAFVGVALQ